MTDLPKCPDCGMAPSLRVRSRGMNWGSAEVRCSNGCPGRRVGFSFPSGGEAAARQLLEEKWKELWRQSEQFITSQMRKRHRGLVD